MNYDKPRQVDVNADGPDAGKWRWTTHNDRGGTHATGYCSPWELCPENHGLELIGTEYDCATCGGRGVVDKADPCPGHDTAEEAAEHYRQWKLDHVRFRVLNNPNALHKCRVEGCGEFTAGIMEIEGDGYFMESVCEPHQTRETAETLITRPGEEWHS